MRQRILFLFAFITGFTVQLLTSKPPKLTVIIVLDQFAYHEFQTLKHHFSEGIRHMYDNGICYEQAYVPHALPETAVGHASLSTGALPKDHGIIANRWYDASGHEISSDDDTPQRAAVFSPNGFYKYGKSAHNIMVDGLSDQVLLKPEGKRNYAVVAVSHKSRAALTVANKLGQAFWFDLHTGFFTSSKAVCDELPDWVTAFNKRKKMNLLTTFDWPLFHDKASYYATKNDDYSFCGGWGTNGHGFSIAGKELVLDKNQSSTDPDRGPYELFAKTPAGNQLLIDFAKACIHEYCTERKTDHVVLWVSCSSPDKIGHPYGPCSLEKIDMLYHVDHQVKELIDYAQRKVGDGNVLFVLTSDHGITPIPEVVEKKGYAQARRIYLPDLVKVMNAHIEKKHGIGSSVLTAKDSNFYLNAPVLNELTQNKRKAVINSLKAFLKSQDGIKNVWTFQELADSDYHLELGELEAFYKNQLFKGRSGHLICQPYPYVLMTSHKYGTSHSSPYDYDTHVPLMIYQKGRFKPTKIMNQVWIQQLPVTLAQLLDVPKPSASTFKCLPGIL